MFFAHYLCTVKTRYLAGSALHGHLRELFCLRARPPRSDGNLEVGSSQAPVGFLRTLRVSFASFVSRFCFLLFFCRRRGQACPMTCPALAFRVWLRLCRSKPFVSSPISSSPPLRYILRSSPRSLRLCGGFSAFPLHAPRLTPHAPRLTPHASRLTPFSAPSAPLRWIFRLSPSRPPPHAPRFTPFSALSAPLRWIFRLSPSRFTPFSALSAPLRWIFRLSPSRLTPHASRPSPRSLRLCGGFFHFFPLTASSSTPPPAHPCPLSTWFPLRTAGSGWVIPESMEPGEGRRPSSAPAGADRLRRWEIRPRTR